MPLRPAAVSRAAAPLLVTALILAAGALPASADKAADIDALISRYAAMNQFNGSILVSEHGAVILKKGYGLANVEWGIPNGPDTKFRLGSITKQFTSMVVMQLVEEGKLSLDAKLSDVLPWYRKDTGSKVTIRHLLTHTSGIPSYTAQPGFFDKDARMRTGVREFVEKSCSGNLEFEPGTKYAYDNSGYFLLGAVIEEVDRKPYEESLAARIFGPLGMKSSGYDHAEPILAKRASGYERRGAGAGAVLTNAAFLDMTTPYAAGALYSTVEDLFLWDQALYGTKLLPEARKKEMFTPVLQNYAFGWVVGKGKIGKDGEEKNIIGHDGGINGFNTTLKRVVDDRHLVVLLSNAGGAPLDAMSRGILDVLYGRKPAPPKRAAAEVLAAVFVEKGADAGVARYRELRKANAPDVDLSENPMNNLGYQLLQGGKVDAALAVFGINAEEHPDSWNVWDSLGEAQAAKGLTAEAIRSYEKTLAMNPKNPGAEEALKKLRAK